MLKKFGLPTLVILALIIINQPTFGQEEEKFKPSGKVWGYMFGDMLYKVGGDTLKFGKGEYANMPKDAIGGKLRRVYFGYDYNISPKWSTRFLSEGTAGTTTPAGNFGMVIKLGYLEFKDVIKHIPNSTLRLGLIPTPVFAFPEKSWGYRSVEKEALDLRGLGNSVDQGASFQGSFDTKNTAGFTLMIGNGSGNKPIIGKHLEYYASVHKKFFNNKLNVEFMFDHKKVDSELSSTLTRLFLSYELPHFRFGAEVAPNNVKEKVTVEGVKKVVNTEPLLASTFASAELYKNLWLFLRFDYLNPDLNYSSSYKYANIGQNYNESLFIGGLQWLVNSNVNVMPNLYVSTYHRKTEVFTHRKPDIVMRTTAYFVF